MWISGWSPRQKKEVGFAISSANSIFTVSAQSVGFIFLSEKAKDRLAFPPSSIDVLKPW